MRLATKVIRSTLTPVVAGEPIHHGPVFAAPFHTPGDPGENAYTYARSHNPTWTALESALAMMESGEGYNAKALLYGSGIAAIAAVFGAVLKPGDIAVLPSDCYFGARALMEQQFLPMGIEVRMAATAGDAQAALLSEAGDKSKGRVKLLWIETPSNPKMDVCDIAHLSALAHKVGALVGVDNTTATPLGQSPLALGADFSMSSDTKLISGHGDLLAGHVAVREGATDSAGANLYDKLLQGRTMSGAILGPMEAWLILRSIPSLPLRLERSCANAMALAKFLTTRKEVLEVRYPGLDTHPGHALAMKQMRAFGPVLSFVLKDKQTADQFLANAKYITDATSFGAIHTTAERRRRWGHDDIPEGLVRLSAGCEDVQDLIDDITQALQRS